VGAVRNQTETSRTKALIIFPIYIITQPGSGSNNKIIVFLTISGGVYMAVKRIIDGKLYDTKKSKRVATYTAENYYIGSFSESLYIKKTGEWFRLITNLGDDFCGGNCRGKGYDIEPYSEDQAKEWLVAYDFVDEYIEHFGEPEE